jgi:hypothetical protein
VHTDNLIVTTISPRRGARSATALDELSEAVPRIAHNRVRETGRAQEAGIR